MKVYIDPGDARQSRTAPPPGGLSQAQQLFAAENLPLPPLPAELAPRMRLLAPRIFGTRGIEQSPYNLDWFVQEAVEGLMEDYLLLGHAGHGVNSWAIHYYLVRGPLALFIQVGFGGAYIKRDSSVQKLTAAFIKAQELIRRFEKAQDAGWLSSASQRWVVVASDFYGSRWTRIALPTDEKRMAMAQTIWHSSADAVSEVLEEINPARRQR